MELSLESLTEAFKLWKKDSLENPEDYVQGVENCCPAQQAEHLIYLLNWIKDNKEECVDA